MVLKIETWALGCLDKCEPHNVSRRIIRATSWETSATCLICLRVGWTFNSIQQLSTRPRVLEGWIVWEHPLLSVTLVCYVAFFYHNIDPTGISLFTQPHDQTTPFLMIRPTLKLRYVRSLIKVRKCKEHGCCRFTWYSCSVVVWSIVMELTGIFPIPFWVKRPRIVGFRREASFGTGNNYWSARTVRKLAEGPLKKMYIITRDVWWCKIQAHRDTLVW